MRRFTRSRIALLLTVVYTLIIVSPLAPLPLRSTLTVSAITGECGGECSVCGCAPEKAAAHTCCCAKKKQLERERAVDRNNSHCEKAQVLSCGCARGEDTQPALWDADNLELLPYHFSGEVLPYREGDLAFLFSDRRADRRGEPPDPPPKLAGLS